MPASTSRGAGPIGPSNWQQSPRSSLAECRPERAEHSADFCFGLARATTRISNHSGQERPPPRGHPRGRRRRRRGGSLLPAPRSVADRRPPRETRPMRARMSLRFKRFSRQLSAGDLPTKLSTGGRRSSPLAASTAASTCRSPEPQKSRRLPENKRDCLSIKEGCEIFGKAKASPLLQSRPAHQASANRKMTPAV